MSNLLYYMYVRIHVALSMYYCMPSYMKNEVWTTCTYLLPTLFCVHNQPYPKCVQSYLFMEIGNHFESFPNDISVNTYLHLFHYFYGIENMHLSICSSHVYIFIYTYIYIWSKTNNELAVFIFYFSFHFVYSQYWKQKRFFLFILFPLIIGLFI